MPVPEQEAAMSSDDEDYEVGYGKPPKHSRFKLGQSGNPKGRPKGSRNRVPSEFEDNRLRAIIHDEANRFIQIQDAKGKKQYITTKKAVVRAITVNALKGHQRSQRLFTELVGETERIEQQERMANFEGALKYKEAWTNEIARRRANRLSPPHQLPHPDDIKLDFATLEVTIAGPMTKEEKVLWDRWREIRDAMNDEVEELRACYGDDPEFLQVLEVAKQALVGPNLALGGSRRVCSFSKAWIERRSTKRCSRDLKGAAPTVAPLRQRSIWPSMPSSSNELRTQGFARLLLRTAHDGIQVDADGADRETQLADIGFRRP
jgi:hypothetical protein